MHLDGNDIVGCLLADFKYIVVAFCKPFSPLLMILLAMQGLKSAVEKKSSSSAIMRLMETVRRKGMTDKRKRQQEVFFVFNLSFLACCWNSEPFNPRDKQTSNMYLNKQPLFWNAKK